MDLIDDIFLKRYILICLGLGLLLLFSFWLKNRFGSGSQDPKPFRDSPSSYHKKYIVCYGQISRILKDRFSYNLRRLIKNFICTVFRVSSYRGRYEHQRMIVVSPQLRRQETLLITHNIKFGKIPIKCGDWIEVSGEYIHRPGYRRGFWGVSRTYYGLVHNTHEPLGYIKILEKQPADETIGDIVVVERDFNEGRKDK